MTVVVDMVEIMVGKSFVIMVVTVGVVVVVVT